MRADAIRHLQRHRPPCAREVLRHHLAPLDEEDEDEHERTAEDREVDALARRVLAELGDA